MLKREDEGSEYTEVWDSRQNKVFVSISKNMN